MTKSLNDETCYRSSTKEGVQKPIYAGFVDVDVGKDRSISLRTLVSEISAPYSFSVPTIFQ
jgi:hypothetical protein